MFAGLRLSVGLFTAIPSGDVSAAATRPRTVRAAILLAPLIGLGLGVIAAVVLFVVRGWIIPWRPTDAEIVAGVSSGAVLAIATLALLTRGLHLDGLADTVDALASGADRERALEIMKRSDVGPMGVLAIVGVLAIDTSALLTAAIRGHGTLATLTAVVAGRVAAVWACRLPAARAEGLGRWVAGSVTTVEALLVTFLALAVPVGLVWCDDDSWLAVLPFAVAAVPVAVGVSVALQRRWVKRFGGITGDTIGAGIEIATAVALLVLALSPT